MIGLRILIGSLVLLMIKESYQTVCYNRNGDQTQGGVFCFDTSPACWSNLNPSSRLRTMGNQFYLFTRQYGRSTCSFWREIFWVNSTFGDFSSYRETIVIIHGWNIDIRHEYMTELCNSFMELGDYNIIMVNWEQAKNLHYKRSKLDSRLVGKELAILLKKLHEHRRLRYSDVHLLGHSLGAHIAGYTGEFLDGQIGHITGLDPAKPGFQEYLNDPDCHLDTTDADFVDVIHSDGSAHALGLEEPVGHQDFYPNKGVSMQPSCWFKPGCSHMRALDFYLSSMKNFDIQPGEDCSFVTTPISPTTCSSWWGCPRMGIHAEEGNTGNFSIEIDSNNCGQDFIY